jgi:hypothetical protein
MVFHTYLSSIYKMKKTILIEDRINRQILFTKKAGSDFLMVEGLKSVSGKREFKELYDKIASKTLEVLDGFDAIIAHRSAFEHADRLVLFDYCAKNKKALIFFSGGITAPVYTDSRGFPFLSLNSKDLYSSKLKLFLEQAKLGDINVMILAFGSNWELNSLIKYELHLTSLLNDSDLDTGVPKIVIEEKLNIPTSIAKALEKEEYTFDWLEAKMIEVPKEHIRKLDKFISSLISTKITFP